MICKIGAGFLLLLVVFVLAAPAANTPDFSGTRIFNASKSTNVGMMVSAQLTSTIKQTPKMLTVRDDSIFNGQKQSQETRYDLTGGPASNDSPMGEKAKTVSKWDGNRLVTNWETEGAVAGTKVLRVEVRYLSEDGKTLFLESARAGKEPMVIVFDRK